MVNLGLTATAHNAPELTIRFLSPVTGNRGLALVAAFVQQIHSGMFTELRAAWNRDRVLDYVWVK